VTKNNKQANAISGRLRAVRAVSRQNGQKQNSSKERPSRLAETRVQQRNKPRNRNGLCSR
jgi:hypothetical protein